MTNNTFKLSKSERENLVREFYDLANRLSPSPNLFSSLKYVLRTWMCLNLTIFIQSTGYNKRKINQWKQKNEKVIINIGSLGSLGNPEYLRADLLLGTRDFPKVFLNQLGYDLLINITSCDKNLINVADGIFLSHVLEHIPPNLALEALKNCFSYLKKDGCLRIVVPDLEKMKLNPTNGLENNIRNVINLNRVFYDWGHKFMYNSDLLIFLLEEAGFSNIEKVNFQKGLLGKTDLAKYKEASIYITAIKQN